MKDEAKHKTLWSLYKFKDPDRRIEELGRRGVPIEKIIEVAGENYMGMSVFGGNILLNEGINEAWKLICGTGGMAFDNTNAQLGVGDSSAAEDATQTDLQGTNKLYKSMDAGYPTAGTDQKAVWRATFGGDDANWAWEEFSVKNANDINLNRKVESKGTKASGTTWILTLEITLS